MRSIIIRMYAIIMHRGADGRLQEVLHENEQSKVDRNAMLEVEIKFGYMVDAGEYLQVFFDTKQDGVLYDLSYAHKVNTERVEYILSNQEEIRKMLLSYAFKLHEQQN